MKRFNEEIIYVKTHYFAIPCLTKVKVVMGKRRYICEDCIYLRIYINCPNSKYGDCCYELGRRCPSIDQIGGCIDMRYKQYNI